VYWEGWNPPELLGTPVINGQAVTSLGLLFINYLCRLTHKSCRLASHFDGFIDPPFKAPPPDLKTPPYVTCNPEITYRKLTLESPTSPKAAPYRFLILATDGLWDELSSKEVVALVSGHLNGLRGSVTKGSITINSLGETQPSRYNGGPSKPNWIFKDENIAAHLIRNAFASTSENSDQLERLLSIPSPLSRRYRDDTSVLVLWWKPEGEGKSQR
jgi:pyruvate dehydrogenase phosphatase